MLATIRARTYRQFVAVLITSFVSLGIASAANAAIITPGQAAGAEATARHAANVASFLARDDVQSSLVTLGVDPDTARDRVAAMTPDELAQLSGKIDSLPAGGVLEVLGVILVVLLILELLGVTNVFTRI